MTIVTTKENTYGFEIEFCTHDNTLLRYTHIEVAKIMLKGDAFESGNNIPLKLETDSGDVLELVTPPIIFRKLENAVQFRNKLANYLKESVASPLTFLEWCERYANALVESMSRWYVEIEQNPLAPIEVDGRWQLVTFAEINPNISVNNIDDGINIAAAIYRKNKMGEDEWKSALNETVLCASTKDWPTGYSTQTSMPMTVQDYVKYLISHKLIKSMANIRRLDALLKQNPTGKVVEISKTLEWEKVEKWATTWFWGGVIFDMFLVYRNKLFPEKPVLEGIKNYLNGDIDEFVKWSKNLGLCYYPIPSIEITVLDAVLFIIVQKTVTGALGGLSEQPQLKKQKSAEVFKNTSAMEDRSKVRKPNKGEYYWCEYHSGLKDLLGVWFKGHLADVLLHLLREEKPETRYRLATALDLVRNDLRSIYNNHLSKVQRVLEDIPRMPYMPEFVYMEEDGQLEKLIAMHNGVINKTAGFVSSDNSIWQITERKQEFLMYSMEGTVWEGRKDTLIKPIFHFNEETKGHETFFLVEHRNN
ncbi:hypothetical protein [Microcystis sp.]|jgi:hypothetical protein|uniref:hypothetical protein n=1 Tax=Microcystis sp. TaxID=1127 RepID=UPI00391A30DF